MKERKYVKLKVNMYEDTKFKIIDTMEDRDLIHYIWTRLVTLAGKVNLEGNLYMSRNIPYTVETLSIEFNRNIEKVELALNVLKDLEMIEVTEDGVYRVRNFAKHQNIKIKEKLKNEENKEVTINIQKEDTNNKEDIMKNIANNNFQNEENTHNADNKNNENSKILKYKENSKELKDYIENNVQSNRKNDKTSKPSKTINQKNSKDKKILNEEGKIIKLSNDKNQKGSKDNKHVQVTDYDFKEKLNDDVKFNSQVILDRKKGDNDIMQIDEDNEIVVFDGIDIHEHEGDTVVKCFEF